MTSRSALFLFVTVIAAISFLEKSSLAGPKRRVPSNKSHSKKIKLSEVALLTEEKQKPIEDSQQEEAVYETLDYNESELYLLEFAGQRVFDIENIKSEFLLQVKNSVEETIEELKKSKVEIELIRYGRQHLRIGTSQDDDIVRFNRKLLEILGNLHEEIPFDSFRISPVLLPRHF